MTLTEPTQGIPSGIHAPDEAKGQVQHTDAGTFQLHRWLVSFASEPDWYPVGEFIAADAPAAIDRAVEIFGSASGCRAEEIPWDAAPLPKANPPGPHWSR